MFDRLTGNLEENGLFTRPQQCRTNQVTGFPLFLQPQCHLVLIEQGTRQLSVIDLFEDEGTQTCRKFTLPGHRRNVQRRSLTRTSRCKTLVERQTAFSTELTTRFAYGFVRERCGRVMNGKLTKFDDQIVRYPCGTGQFRVNLVRKESIQCFPRICNDILIVRSPSWSISPREVDATATAASLGTFSMRKFSNLRVSFSLILKKV